MCDSLPDCFVCTNNNTHTPTHSVQDKWAVAHDISWNRVNPALWCHGWQTIPHWESDCREGWKDWQSDYHLTANPWNNHYGLSLQLIHQSVSPPLSFPPCVSVFIFIPVWTSHAFVCHVICYLLLLCLFRIWCTVILMKNPGNRDVITEAYREQHDNGVRRLTRMTGMCADLYRVWLRISKNLTIQYASCRGYDSI